MPALLVDRRAQPARKATAPVVVVAYVAVALLGATGALRPTGISALDPVLLAIGGVGVAACARRARSLPVYVLAGVTCVLQPELLPLALGLAALAAALVRSMRRRSAVNGILAGGLSWAALVGAGWTQAADPVWVPLLAVSLVVLSARRNGNRRFRRRLDLVVIAGGLVALVGAAAASLALITAKPQVDRGTELLESGLAAARDGDAVAAVVELRRAQDALAGAESTLGAPWARAAWVVPGVSQNARAVHRIVEEVDELAQLGITSAEQADVDSLAVSGGVVDLAAVSAMEAPLEEAVAGLTESADRIDELDSWWLLPPLEDRIDEVQVELGRAVPSAELALEGIRVAPSMLGADGPRTYLVLFTTPVESRARTGFPGNYAELTFSDGRFEKTRFGRIVDLNLAMPDAGGTLELSEDYHRRYDRFSPASEWRSISFTPDFPTVAETARQLYPQSGGREIDGVISLSPAALADLLRFTGPVAVPGVAAPITADSAEDFLVRGQYLELPDNPERIDALEELADTTFDRLVTADLPGPRDLAQVMGPVVEEGHVQMWTFHGDAEDEFLGDLGISGALPPVDGDFLGVTSSNTAMNKIDLFLERTIDYAATWDPSTGGVEATVTVTLTNTAPASGLPDYILTNAVGRNRPDGQDLPDGWNAAFLTVYTPWQAEGATLDGEPLPLEVLPEEGRQAISTFVQLAPGQTRTITLELTGVLDADAYSLDLLGQPMVTPDQAHVSVKAAGGDTIEETYTLVRPEQVTLKP